MTDIWCSEPYQHPRAGFAVPPQADLPPLPGEPPTTAAVSPLAMRFWALLSAAGCHIIPPGALRPDPSMTTDVEAILRAAQGFEVGPGIGLDQRLWCHAGAFWSGDVGAALRDGGQGFLLLFGRDVSDQVVFASHAAPFRVRDWIERPRGATGPFLSLILCRCNPLGKPEAVRGYAQPILSGQRFVPVVHALERDVIAVLLKLRDKLDAYGIDSAIESILPHLRSDEDADLSVRLSDQAGRTQHLGVKVTDGSGQGGAAGHKFVLTPREWADRTFIAWLEAVIMGSEGLLRA